MTIIDELVYDRTQSDVDAVNAKGTYNYTDLNRVNEAVLYLANEAKSLGEDIQSYLESKGVANAEIYEPPFDVSDVDVDLPVIDVNRTTWGLDDLPYPPQMEQYLSNVANLRGLMTMPPTTPAVPEDMQYLTYTEANDIERILADVDEVRIAWIEDIEQKIDYVGTYEYNLICGTFSAGSHRTLQHFSRGR